MEKTGVVESLGQESLLLPIWVKSSLAANDQIKVLLSLLQATTTYAHTGTSGIADFKQELLHVGLTDKWLDDFTANASFLDNRYHIPELPHLLSALAQTLDTMARPVLLTQHEGSPLVERTGQWQSWLQSLNGDYLEADQLQDLTHGRRNLGDSLHLLVMDLHKALNQLSASLASEEIDGAHVWQIDDSDRPLIRAFMSGLKRTAPLKFDHPGLDTAVTRDASRLLIQNDIGTNDAHVIVIQVCDLQISLTYSDLHPRRFNFFKTLLSDFGASWNETASKVTEGLNQNEAYYVGTATFNAADQRQLQLALANIGSRLVFLIDWNKARKRLRPLIGNKPAIAILTQAARDEVGHRAWLECGGEQLIFNAMRSLADQPFKVGDTLTSSLGDGSASHFLSEVLSICSRALREGRPAAMVNDEVRLLLNRLIHQHNCEFDLLMDHAGYCHAMAQSLNDAMLHGILESGNNSGSSSSINSSNSSLALADKAKAWERRADTLVIQGRDLAQQQPRWQPFATLLQQVDDIADALEEAAFLLSLAPSHSSHWGDDLCALLHQFGDTLLNATQEHVKTIAIAKDLRSDSSGSESEAFLAASWQILRAERICDELLRDTRRVSLLQLEHAGALMLINDLVNAMEAASDSLLSCNYQLRDLTLSTSGGMQ